MSSVESNAAIMNGLYENWSITYPAQDPSSQQTQNPSLVHFTTRYYAYAPMRIHPYQISVRCQPDQFIHVQFRKVTKYPNDKRILIETWVLTIFGVRLMVDRSQSHSRLIGAIER